ncbi:MAG TPA: DNA-protecting protein DprA, partial [Gemmatimonadetes bacterium]|nr:DNA-protecting protein DprA [Gemmatimonadota bacterium]
MEKGPRGHQGRIRRPGRRGLGNSLTIDAVEREREIRSVLRLGCLPGVGTRTLWQILDRFGSGRRALDAGPAELDAAAGRKCSVALASAEPARRAQDAMDRCREKSIEILLWTDQEYPERLTQLADPPPVLFARGRLELLGRPAMAIVGSRRSTTYGRRSAEALAAQMVLRGITVVSGLALGIDGAAHRGTLRASGDTIAVLGSGVDLIQPASHRRLGEQISRVGLLLSEFLPGEPARAHHFPRRNSILAALGGAVVVVEAAEKSGALITVEHALDAPQSRGCNTLIRQGAQVITSPEEFGQDLGLVCGSSSEFRARTKTESRVDAGLPDVAAGISPGIGDEIRAAPEDDVPAGLDDEARRVWNVLRARSLGIANVALDAIVRISMYIYTVYLYIYIYIPAWT